MEYLALPQHILAIEIIIAINFAILTLPLPAEVENKLMFPLHMDYLGLF